MAYRGAERSGKGMHHLFPWEKKSLLLWLIRSWEIHQIKCPESRDFKDKAFNSLLRKLWRERERDGENKTVCEYPIVAKFKYLFTQTMRKPLRRKSTTNISFSRKEVNKQRTCFFLAQAKILVVCKGARIIYYGCVCVSVVVVVFLVCGDFVLICVCV